MGMAARAKKEKDTKVIDATFSLVALRRLDALVREGSFGISRPEVIRNFVETGLRAARKDGHITDAEWEGARVPPSANSLSTDD
jgi:hypothetical protein